ncbi:MAG: 1-(5-phosphoribosyl)-5-[(5-phosphoribosylamino)methylideneamino]imidazole-4-carboxamide isomerase [Candidatus Margulisbacteria bacterium]|nr:1-(5-phosphoribosyl)-5-[(5-phosphoribosylamino)methylideneamino]imidazole-4-carboxamide isomerase [Candidatus Margulisiibacteriota bacterium]MBU1616193.1 1-(5-phosphoribosyl)-5-[(5-phosphoribosylamino)methylideneamino]imidazole-4-carboxamide isomerase [Candidatus Margulisiibacteriota bacterium]MBU1867177.1 1-(5-phosphoribosyl)-5-[(5-phosphoribosylamino)methylideneamino]imidazole-4-carboxamide isomerase [Candidatus Margulisiibacteriota bacterium]
MKFEVIPAIDLLQGKCVRLKQGNYGSETIYSAEPLEVAARWVAAGAKRLHVVDLDGAKTGIAANIDIIKAIIKEVAVPIQIGGGVRNFNLISDLLKFGADRVILGTTAIKNPNLLGNVCEKFGDKIAVAIDAKGNFAAAEGWMYVSKKDTLTLAKEAIGLGVKRFVFTDISRDGMLEGPNIDSIKKFMDGVKVPVIASGGVSTKEDVEKLKAVGAEGCIVGKALYDGKLQLEEIL